MNREDAIAAAAGALAHARRLLAERTPRESALAAWTPTGPGVDELEARIRVLRGMPPAAAAS